MGWVWHTMIARGHVPPPGIALRRGGLKRAFVTILLRRVVIGFRWGGGFRRGGGFRQFSRGFFVGGQDPRDAVDDAIGGADVRPGDFGGFVHEDFAFGDPDGEEAAVPSD